MLGTSPDFQQVAAKKYRNVSAWLRDYITAIKNGQMHPFTQIERKAREATRNEAWGPTGTRLNQLADASHSSTDCEIIFAVIQLRLGYPPEKWRNVYKALVLLEFLLQRGSAQCVEIILEDVMPALTKLSTFTYTSPDGKDQGINVRYRAKAIKELIEDKDRLQAERQAHQQKKKAYSGYTKNDISLLPAFNDDQALSTPRSQRSSSLRRTLSDSSMAEPVQTGRKQADAPKLMNAGETKGVSMEVNKKNLEDLRQLLQLPHNRYCADCEGGGAAGRASWASINNGTFICFRCAGVHRGLGVHISKVRSCTLDTWLPEQVAFMTETGNQKANSFLEARLQPSEKPGYDTPQLAGFIRQKYEARAFAASGVWPPVSASPNSARSHKKRPSEDAEGLNQDPTGLESQKSIQRKEPRLPGRRSRTSQSGGPVGAPVRRMVSVPLPPGSAVPAAHQTTLIKAGDLPNLMDFDLDATPSYSAPAGLIQPISHQSSHQEGNGVDPLLHELSNIEIPYNHHTCQATYAFPNASQDRARDPPPAGGVPVPQLDLGQMSHPNLPNWRPLRSQSTASSAILTTGAIVFTDDNGTEPDFSQPSYQHTLHQGGLPNQQTVQQPSHVQKDSGLESLPTIHEPATELGFQEESVQNWSQLTQDANRPAVDRPRSIKARRSLGGESDFASALSTPAFTPRFTALLGPGPQPTWRQNQVSAGLTYNPVAMTSSFKPASYRPQGSRPVSNLKETAAQLSATQAGGNTLDELVLHALADIPSFNRGPHSNVATAKPTSLLQQKTQMRAHVFA